MNRYFSQILSCSGSGYRYGGAMSDATDSETINEDKTISLKIPTDLNDKADAAAKACRLKKADVLRLAIDRGIDILLGQLDATSKTEGDAQ